jgi:predicted RNA binding protein YcfA (HicA-like mRNA interferase family)
MKLPRDLDADELIQRLKQFGYEPTRQTGSHIRLTRVSQDGEHHITIPNHSPLRVGTLNHILGALSDHLKISKEMLLRKIS